MIYKILGWTVLLILVFSIILFVMSEPEEIQSRRINHSLYEETILGFGTPSVILTKGIMHNKDCEKPSEPVYIKINRNTNVLKITDSLLKRKEYCCEPYKEHLEKSEIIYLYRNIKQDSIIMDMEIIFREDKIMNQRFRYIDTLNQDNSNKIQESNSIF